jgi:hypothetical protein
MSSSTSSSDASRWRGFVVTFVASACLIATGLAGLVAALDPYDRGAFGESHAGVAEGAPRIADASRARDPAFDAAVIGNSHIQLVDPAALSRDSGMTFVSLAIPGTGPREQLAVLDAFRRHHGDGTRALVIGVDPTWCTEDQSLPMTNPFPFWLYHPDALTYLRGLIRFGALEQAVRRIGLTLGWTRPARRDGYWNYATGRSPGFRPPPSATAEDRPADDPIAETRRFPALDRLAERLDRLPAGTAVALVRPPVHVAALPRAGSAAERTEAACRAALLALAARRAATSVVDLRRDDGDARDAGLWFDDTHYAEPVARRIEGRIAAALVRGEDPARAP